MARVQRQLQGLHLLTVRTIKAANCSDFVDCLERCWKSARSLLQLHAPLRLGCPWQGLTCGSHLFVSKMRWTTHDKLGLQQHGVGVFPI